MKFSDPYTNIEQLQIEEGMHVADFGSGVGFYALYLAKKVGSTGKVYAIDIQGEHLKKLKKEAGHRGYTNIEVIQSDLEQPAGSGLMGHSLDRVVVSNLLFQVDDIFMVAEEVKRVLKSSGLVAVIDWAESFNQIGPHRDHVIPVDHVRKAFEVTGFDVVTRLDAGSHHYGFVFRPRQGTI